MPLSQSQKSLRLHALSTSSSAQSKTVSRGQELGVESPREGLHGARAPRKAQLVLPKECRTGPQAGLCSRLSSELRDGKHGDEKDGTDLR